MADAAEDETERKRIQMGHGAYSLLVLFSSVAFFCGLSANASCNYAGREFTWNKGFNFTAACDSLQLDPADEGICESLLTDSGVGFYNWYGTVPIDTQVCLSYTLWNPYVNGWITPDFDSKFHSAVIFSIMANCFGAIPFITFIMSNCCLLTQDRLYGFHGTFFMACLFQGLSLLIFTSNVCEKGFLLQYFPNAPSDFVSNIDSVKCVQGMGSRLAITATVFYFLSMHLIPKAIVPLPFRYTAPVATAPAPVATTSAPPPEEIVPNTSEYEEA